VLTVTRCGWLSLGIAIAAGGCEERTPDCSAVLVCEPCTMQGCAWCFENGECLPVDTLCPGGERALAPEQCELDDEAAAVIDATATWGSSIDLAR
jgi:hypothetical protein